MIQEELGDFPLVGFFANGEISHNRLYDLLSLAYDPSSIHHIRENLESGTSEGIGFAIELLDLFIAEEIKPVLFPVLEDNSAVDKIRQLQAEFPIQIMAPGELLTAVINRDPNLLSPFTKAAAINEYSAVGADREPDGLIAQVFNPDELLSGLAAFRLSLLDPGRYGDVMRRLSPEKRNRLAVQVREEAEGKQNLIWDRMQVMFRNPYLADLPFRVIYRLAMAMEPAELNAGGSLSLAGADGEPKILLLRSGRIALYSGEEEMGELVPFEMAGTLVMSVKGGDTLRVQSAEPASLLLAERRKIASVMFDHEELALSLYRWAGEQESRMNSTNSEMVS